VFGENSIYFKCFEVMYVCSSKRIKFRLFHFLSKYKLCLDTQLIIPCICDARVESWIYVNIVVCSITDYQNAIGFKV